MPIFTKAYYHLLKIFINHDSVSIEYPVKIFTILTNISKIFLISCDFKIHFYSQTKEFSTPL